MDDFKIRPYSVGMTEQPQNLSSIILFTDNFDNVIDEKINERDFLSDFSSPINELLAQSTESAMIKEDDMPGGNIYVATPEDGTSLDGVNNYYGVFNNFSLLAVRETHDEIIKIHQNFDNSWNVFFFGERPAVYNFNGVFIDSIEYPYYQEFMVAYEKLLAGRKCIENKTRMYLSCDNKVIEGYMINISATKTAETSLKKDFSFSLLVRNVYWVRNNLIIISDGNGKIKYEQRFNGMSNFGRLNLNEIGLNLAQGL